MPSIWSSAVRWNVPVCAPRVEPLSSEMFFTPERSVFSLDVQDAREERRVSERATVRILVTILFMMYLD